jgi:hypothetical protein
VGPRAILDAMVKRKIPSMHELPSGVNDTKYGHLYEMLFLNKFS